MLVGEPVSRETVNGEIDGLLAVTSAVEKNRAGTGMHGRGASQTALGAQPSRRRTVSAKALR